MKKEYFVSSTEGLQPVCEELRSLEKEYDLFCFIGDLGAGKTTIIKEWMRISGVEDLVSSPTFSIINEYQSETVSYFHMDLYRLKDASEAIEIGLYEYIDSGQICIIEWPEIIFDQLPEKRVQIQVTANEEERHILLESL